MAAKRGTTSGEMASHAPVTFSEFKGVRFLHLGTGVVQGAMRLANPDAIELEYVQQMMLWMLFIDLPGYERSGHERPGHAGPGANWPRHIAQLGLGSGALTKFCYRQFPDAKVTAVELNPAVIAACRAHFALPPDDARLQVLEADALDFVSNPARHGSIDILQVDVYDAAARGPVLDSPEFYQACADCLSENGMLTVNLYGEYESYGKNLHGLEMAFDAVAWLPVVHDANIIAIAFKRAPDIDFSVLNDRAAMIRKSMNLRAKSWVNGLKTWMLHET